MDQNNMDRYIGQMLDDRYEILEVIGRGGMAVVYKARCHLMNRFVAIKILRDDMAADEEFRTHFKKEAQAVAMLSHPNIVSPEEMLMISGNNQEPEKTCGALLELALKRGAPDNVSVLLCER